MDEISHKLEFDPNHPVSYCKWRCPECGNVFYAGGRALHKEGCSQTDYSKCICIIGPKVVAHVKEWAESNGEDSLVPLSPINLRDIQQQLPHVL
jgi:hypothetical protein